MKTKLLITILGIFLMTTLKVFSVNPAVSAGEMSSEAQFANGKVLTVKIPCEGIMNNTFGDADYRKVSIYLPPGYDANGTVNYPVLYMLSDFNGTNEDWFQFFGTNDLPVTLDKLVASKKIKPMILVFPDGSNKLGGGWYTNSSVAGNYEDFVVEKVVTYVDQNFKTLPFADSRGIAGKGMGAYGALKLATKHPGVFSTVYALNALVDFNTFFTHEHIWSKSINSALQAGEYPTDDDLANLLLSMSVAFAPNNHSSVVAGALPLTAPGTVNNNVFEKWLENDPLQMIQLYPGNLKTLKSLTIDCSTGNARIMLNNNYSEALKNAGIDHIFSYYDGSENEQLANRVTQVLLPSFSDKLAHSLMKCDAKICNTYDDVLKTSLLTDGTIFISPVQVNSDGVMLKSESIMKYHVKANETQEIELADMNKGLYSIYGISNTGFEGEAKLFGLNGGTPKVNICVTDYNTGKKVLACGLNVNGTVCIPGSNGEFNLELSGKTELCFQKENYGQLTKSVMIYTDTTLSYVLVKDSYVQVVEKGVNSPVFEATVTHGNLASLSDKSGFATVENEILNCRIFKTGFFTEVVSMPMKPGDTKIIELSKKKANITFIVMSQNGPEAGVYVYLNDQYNYSDENGKVYFEDLDTRVEYTCSVRNSGFEEIHKKIYLEADEHVSINLVPEDNLSESMDKSGEAITHSNEFLMKDFKVYPNPAKDYVTVETDGTELYAVELLTQSGTVIYKSIVEGNKHRINMSNLSNGVYFVTVKSNNVNRTQRVMKL